jgi:ABC-2 type transport system permease protein
VKPQELGGPLTGLASPALARPSNPFAVVANVVSKTLVIVSLELRKLRHDPTELLTRAVQPSLWLLIFGQVFTRVRAIPTGQLRYLDFLTPGILAQSVLFIAIFHGIAVIWERDLGILHKFLASPAPRLSLVLGKALSAGVRGGVQAIFIYGLGLALGVRFNWSLLALAGVLVAVILGAAFFALLSLIIACVVKTRERFMGMGQVVTMPLFFASNAIYPISMMPGWLQVVSRINPLTYEVDALRGLMIAGGTSTLGLPLDFGVLLCASTAAAAIGARMYPRVVM